MNTITDLAARDDVALVLIDIQNDFLPDGALAVPNGDEILRPVENLARQFDNIIITQDWHPARHSSFASSHEGKAPFEMTKMPYGDQVLWPDHCVMGSFGADLRLSRETRDKAQLIIRKGFRPDIDSYSAFLENDQMTPTGLKGYLQSRRIKHLVFAGLATDYCVGFSAIDAAAMGFRSYVYLEGCRGIAQNTIDERTDQMIDAGVTLL